MGFGNVRALDYRTWLMGWKNGRGRRQKYPVKRESEKEGFKWLESRRERWTVHFTMPTRP